MYVDIFNTNKKYNIIYADPPWSYRNCGNIHATAKKNIIILCYKKILKN